MFTTIVLGLCLLCSTVQSFHDEQPPRYIVNLDSPPAERWGHIVSRYSAIYPIIEEVIYKIVPKPVVDLITDVVAKLDYYIPAPYADEIRGVAKYTNSTVGDTLLGNLAYDFTAFKKKGKNDKGACTSIIAIAENGTLFHGRNLDYNLNDLLRNLTIVVDYQRNGTTIYTGTTFAGYVGILTGMRVGGVSISLNERNTGKWWENFVSAAKTRLQGLIGMAIRDTLEDTSIDYATAVQVLSTRELIAPCYLIVGGVKPNEAVVITRDRLKAVDVWHINNGTRTGNWYILETNYDHWKAPPPDDDRRGPAISALAGVGRGSLNMHTLYSVLSTPPILNNGTTYTTIMTVHGLYYTMTRHP